MQACRRQCSQPGAVLFFRSLRQLGTLASEVHCGSDECKRDAPVGLFLHGLLGQGKNWRTFARKLAQRVEESTGSAMRLYTLDLRNHGRSSRLRGFEAPHTVEAAAADVLKFVNKELRGQQPHVVCGHSLGGKVALEYVRLASSQSNQATPEHVWVLDSQPGRLAPDSSPDVEQVLKAVSAVPTPIPDRYALLDDLRQQGFSEALVQWIGSSLVPLPQAPAGQLTWAFDVTGAADMFASYKATDRWDVVAAPPAGVHVHVVRGAQSDRWTAELLATLEASLQRAADGQAGGRASGYVLEGAGHWVHADQPDKLQEMLLPSFQAAVQR